MQIRRSWATSIMARPCTRLARVSRLIFATACVAFPAAALPLTWNSVTTVDPLAVCNDGSPAGYYFRAGTNEGVDKWVITFQGGGWCWDTPTCQSRLAGTPYLMSSKLLPATTEAGVSVKGIPDITIQPWGITSEDATENPHYHDWNQAFVWYCTSDSHLGDAAAGGFQWRGKRVMTAMVQQLLSTHNLGAASIVLVAGDSAGGVGAANNAGAILRLIQPHTPQLETFKAFVDAGWFLDAPNYLGAGFTFTMLSQLLKTAYGVTYDKTCEAYFGQTNAWKCFFASYNWPILPVPTFFHEYLYDVANQEFLQAKQANLEDLRAKTLASFSVGALPNTTSPLPAIFAPACVAHEIIDSLLFDTSQVGSAKLVDVLHAWLLGQGGSPRYVDDHPGPRTSAECLPSSIQVTDAIEGLAAAEE